MKKPPPKLASLQRRSIPSRVASRRPRRVIYVFRRKHGINSWLVAFLLFGVCVGAFGYYFHEEFYKPRPVAVTAGASPKNPRSETRAALENEEDFKLPDIIENPEKDDERIFMDLPVSDDLNFDFDKEAAQDPSTHVETPPPPKPPKKLDKPKLVRKYVTNKVPNEFDINTARTLDVLILFTPTAKDKLGGPQGVLARANNVIDHANKRFNRKGAKGRLRLVGLAEVEYEPAEDAGTDLKRMSRLKSGPDTIHTIRRKVGADLVSLFSDSRRGGGGGVAYVPGEFSAMNFPVGAIFAHEIQHNLGWHHHNRDDFSMINKNFPQFAKKQSRRISTDDIYMQYWTDVEEEAPKK